MHTAFNVIVAMVAYPFLGWMLSTVGKTLVPDPTCAEDETKSFLNPEALDTPPVALAQATREVLRMTDAVNGMLQNLWAALSRKNQYPIKNIRVQDDAIDEINQQIMLYLTQLSEMNDFDRKWHFTLLT